MSGPYIHVRLQPGPYPSDRDVSIGLPLSECLVRDTFVPLDHPSKSTDMVTAAIFCTDVATIRRVMIDRQHAAKIIAEAVAKAVLDAMEAKDTEMGYPKRKRG